MTRRQNMWMPLIAGIGIGAVATGLMRGQGGNVKSMAQNIPALNQMQRTTGTDDLQNQ
ncbi:hypothetical protein [Pseudalkalibacillus salsuginis]|uniref:hypothetical protein n=1 Tax=Pseudalkalibacillus salsuginis TaxID=2910972 RepID=UPI001F39B313|nr:hypothetical protein [Pseudalkalibacillus salsuginis]MCF6408802.1 hypothetical protein [Pseudalkalibacillus salsuginis]